MQKHSFSRNNEAKAKEAKKLDSPSYSSHSSQSIEGRRRVGQTQPRGS